MNELSRHKIEIAIEALIDLLDAFDPDADLEADEPESDGDDEDYDLVMFS